MSLLLPAAYLNGRGRNKAPLKPCEAYYNINEISKLLS